MITILRLIIHLLAGLGAGSILDKFAADKLPAYPAEGVSAPITKDYQTGGINIPKIAWFLIAAIAGTFIVKFIGRKLNIKLLK